MGSTKNWIPYPDFIPRNPGWFKMVTLSETNIAPENMPLEKEIPIGNHHF